MTQEAIGAPPPPLKGRGMKVVLGLTAALGLGGVVYLGVMEAQRARLVPDGVAAPSMELPRHGGGTLKLEELKGQVVMLDFWATWCPPCREEMPSMVRLGRELEAKYPGRFRMVAVSVDESWDPVKEFFAAPPYFGKPGLAVTLDPEQKTTRAYYCGARGGTCPDLKFPETYIVDGEGRLVAYVVGPRDWSDPSARLLLESIIDS